MKNSSPRSLSFLLEQGFLLKIHHSINYLHQKYLFFIPPVDQYPDSSSKWYFYLKFHIIVHSRRVKWWNEGLNFDKVEINIYSLPRYTKALRARVYCRATLGFEGFIFLHGQKQVELNEFLTIDPCLMKLSEFASTEVFSDAFCFGFVWKMPKFVHIEPGKNHFHISIPGGRTKNLRDFGTFMIFFIFYGFFKGFLRFFSGEGVTDFSLATVNTQCFCTDISPVKD